MPSLFEPLVAGELKLANRIVMAPLTRCRAAPGRVPNDLNVEYYVQRASAGMILSEATAVTPKGVGYPDTPGLWSAEQVAGWRKVTDAVHAAGGVIVAQLWHVGRISDPYYLDGDLPVSASAVQPAGHVSLMRPKKAYETPRALETAEIAGVIEAYRQAAVNAEAAGFDGVELHAANGYLIDQFLQDKVNRRTDAYGGSIENRARLLLEVTDALISVWGPGRVGIHLAPRCDSHDMGDSDPRAVFTHAAAELGKRKVAFLFLRERLADDSLLPAIKAAFGGVVIANEGLTKASAQALLDAGTADAASWGKDFIANPDLVRRLAEDAPLNAWVMETFYGVDNGPKGYTDYPALEPAEA
jgi:2,4-dienoyl-CoA reductase-like NADH-dependent reductase (Old Yellow Enzyme family)